MVGTAIGLILLYFHFAQKIFLSEIMLAGLGFMIFVEVFVIAMICSTGKVAVTPGSQKIK